MWTAEDVKTLISKHFLIRTQQTRRRSPYPVVRVDGADGPTFYRLVEDVSLDQVTLENLDSVTDEVYDYYLWMCGKNVMCRVVKTLKE